MKFEATSLAGAYVAHLEPRGDDRGFFARAFCQREFAALGIDPTVVQTNFSFSAHKGTLRGMHYQVEPSTETKFVRCIRGAIHDVIVDLRKDSPTYLQHFGVKLSAENRDALYVPGMFAHGYLTLEDDTEVLYQVGEYYNPECERGFRPDDPAIGIKWPIPIEVLSDKDRSWPDFDVNA